MTRKKTYEWLVWTGLCVVGLLLLRKTSGVVTFALAMLIVLGFFSALRVGIELIAGLFHKAPKLTILRKVTLACLSLMMGLLLFEIVLQLLALAHAAEQPAGVSPQALTMPDDWKIREANIPGAERANYWHNVLHIYNRDSMRLLGSFGPKRADTFRVMVVGDSLTYGQGVSAEATYCSLLEKELSAKYRIEVLNLGRCGDQSEDILRTVKNYLPKLQPDLVIYGVCLNDLLHSGRAQYQNNLAWSIWFPFQKHFSDKTRLGGFLAKKYDDVLMALGVRADFYTDILRDFDGYQQRFARDVRDMNDVVKTAGLPPVLAMVLHQYLNDEKGLRIMTVAEKLLSDAGLQVIPSQHYVNKHAGKIYMVSQWEGHPNEEGHRIFAGEILPYLEEASGLEKFRRTAAESSSF